MLKSNPVALTVNIEPFDNFILHASTSEELILRFTNFILKLLKCVPLKVELYGSNTPSGEIILLHLPGVWVTFNGGNHPKTSDPAPIAGLLPFSIMGSKNP